MHVWRQRTEKEGHVEVDGRLNVIRRVSLQTDTSDEMTATREIPAAPLRYHHNSSPSNRKRRSLKDTDMSDMLHMLNTVSAAGNEHWNELRLTFDL